MKKIGKICLLILIAVLLFTYGLFLHYNYECKTDQSFSDAIYDRMGIYPDVILCKKEVGKDLYILFEQSDTLYFVQYIRNPIFKNRYHFASGAGGAKDKFNIFRFTEHGNTYHYVVFADNRNMHASYYTAEFCGDSYVQKDLGEFIIDPYTGHFSEFEEVSLIAYGEDGNVIDTVE